MNCNGDWDRQEADGTGPLNRMQANVANPALNKVKILTSWPLLSITYRTNLTVGLHRMQRVVQLPVLK